MEKPLRVLNVEDSEPDVALLRRHLSTAGYALTADRVETAEDMAAALKEQEWDVILCDYSMPQFNALAALDVLKESGLDIPLIIISGTVGEAVAVEAMRAGAQDYMMKDNLARLEPTIERELHEAENRRLRRQADLERKILFKIIQGSVTTTNLEEFLILVHRSIGQIVSAENCFVMLNDSANDLVHFEFWADQHDPLPTPRPLGKGFADFVLRTGKAILLTDELKKQMYERGEAEEVGTSAASWLGVPLHTPTGTIGVLVLQHYEDENAYSKRDLEFLSSVGDQIAIVIERKRADEALKRSEEQYRELVENATDIIYTLDLKGNYTSVNAAGERITGYLRQESLTRNINLTVAPEYQELAARMQAEQLAGRDVPAFEIEVIAKDGRRVALEVNTRAIKENGIPVGLQGIARDITERKKVAKALVESEERNRELIENATDIIYTHDLEGNYTSLNKAGERITGYSLQEALARKISDSVAPEDVEKAREMIAEKLAGKETTAYEIDVIAKDGNRVSLEVNSRIIYENDIPVGVQGIARDITERKLANASLLESENRYRTLFETSPDGVAMFDLEMKVLVANGRSAEIFGYSNAEEMIGKSAFDLIAPENLDRARSNISGIFESGHLRPLESTGIRADGSLFAVEFSATLIRNIDGQSQAVLGVTRDITERKKIREALTESEERYRELVENAIDVIYTLDLEGNYTSINRASEEITGYTVEESLKRNIVESMAPAYREKARELLAAQVHGENLSAFELEILAKDGRQIALEIKTRPIKENGIAVGVQGIARDITERKRTEAALEESEATFRALFDTSNDAIMVLSDGVFIDCNSSTEVLFACRKEEILGVSPLTLSPTEQPDGELSAAKVTRYLGAAMKGEPQRFEWKHLRPDGTLFDAEVSLNKVDFLGVSQLQAIVRDITERKRADAALRASEASFKSLFDTANDAILLLNDGVFTDCNRRAEILFGSRDWIIGRSPLELSPEFQPDGQRSADKVPGHIKRTLTGEPQFFEWQHIRMDGTPFDTDISLNKVELRGETHIQSIIRDITERKRIEKTIIENEAKFRDLFDNAPVAYHELDVNGCYTRINQTEALMLGYTNDELRGRHVSDFIVEKISRESVKAKLGGQLDFTAQERTFIRKDGTHISVLIEDRLIYDANGEISGIRTTLQDITERKRAEAAMRESEERFSGAFEFAPIGVALVSPDGHWLKVNLALCELVGYAEEELLGMTFHDITYKEDLDDDIDHMYRLIDGEISSYQIEKRYVHKLGHLVSILLNVSLVRDEQGLPRYFISQIQNMTDRKQLEEQFRQAQKMEAVGVLAGGIAHDFNNLLTAINGYSDLTLRKMAADEPLRRNIEEIKRAGDRAAELTSQLLSFSRKQVLKPVVHNLNAVVVNIEKMLKRIIRENVELRTFLDAELGNIKADPGQVEQVIMNLAVNARDAMPGGGTLTIETQNVYLDEDYVSQKLMIAPGPFARLTITDTGDGMDAATQEHIFEPFFTTKQVGKGTGLGLSMVYGIVKQSGGDIMVYSEPGHGSTFKIYLPRVDEQVQKPKWNGDREERSLGTETILLVEDEEVVRRLVSDILTENGYTVLDAENGKAALAICKVRQEHIDMLLTDVIMPGMGGTELKQAVVEIRPEIKVLFMSGYTDDSIANRGIFDADTAFIEKPFTPDALARKVREVLEDL